MPFLVTSQISLMLSPAFPKFSLGMWTQSKTFGLPLTAPCNVRKPSSPNSALQRFRSFTEKTAWVCRRAIKASKLPCSLISASSKWTEATSSASASASAGQEWEKRFQKKICLSQGGSHENVLAGSEARWDTDVVPWCKIYPQSWQISSILKYIPNLGSEPAASFHLSDSLLLLYPLQFNSFPKI